MAKAAPVPSPSLICKSNRGVSPTISSSAACPGSEDRWPANMNSPTLGSSTQATAAAAVEIKPSITTGIRREAAPTIKPVSPAISNPPTFRSTSRGSEGSGRLTSKARSITSIFFLRPGASRPVPHPVTCAAGRPVRTEVMALAAVVLPIPISPVPMRVWPSFSARAASSIPTSRAA